MDPAARVIEHNRLIFAGRFTGARVLLLHLHAYRGGVAMNIMKKSRGAAILLFLCMTAISVSNPAAAVPVSVQMGFTNFTGTVGSDFQFTTYFDHGTGAELICPDAGCGTGIDVATAT